MLPIVLSLLIFFMEKPVHQTVQTAHGFLIRQTALPPYTTLLKAAVMHLVQPFLMLRVVITVWIVWLRKQPVQPVQPVWSTSMTAATILILGVGLQRPIIQCHCLPGF